MSSTRIKIFLTGATGYIGGSVLNSLLEHSNATNFDISVLIRSGDNERINKLQSLGLKTLIGSNDSHELIENAAKESHVVIHTSNSADDLASTMAIISGLNQQIQTTGRPAIYIHTSGTGVLHENICGEKGSDIVYNDLDPVQINGLPDEQLHRNVDLFIINAADANPLLKTVIVLPPLIYGIGSGLFNRTSVQLPLLIRAALRRKRAGMIGPGDATWNHVHIADLADAFLIIFDQLLAAYGPNASADVKPSSFLTTGREGYYFVENGTHSWRQLSEKVGEVLYTKGLVEDPEVDSFPDNKIEGEPWAGYATLLLGSQSSSKAERIRKLGWKPCRATIFDSVDEQVDAIIKNNDY